MAGALEEDDERPVGWEGPLEGLQQRLLAYMALALGNAQGVLQLGPTAAAQLGDPAQRTRFFCYHFQTFANLVIWKVRSPLFFCTAFRECLSVLNELAFFGGQFHLTFPSSTG